MTATKACGKIIIVNPILIFFSYLFLAAAIQSGDTRLALPKYPEKSLFLRSLGFAEDPFSTAPDPRFLFLSSQHGPLMERLNSIIDRSFGLAVVDGERGTGKSIVARRLESYCLCRPDSYLPVFLNIAHLESGYEALGAISDRLVLPRRKSIEAQLRGLTQHIRHAAEEGRTTVILIDVDAPVELEEPITKEALKQLSDIAAETAPVFIFTPTRSMASLGKSSDLLQAASRFNFGNLNLEDTTGMVNFRCMVAGRKAPLMQPDVIGYIWESAFGNPGKIIRVCNRLLNAMQEENTDTASLTIAVPVVEALAEEEAAGSK